MKKILLLLSSLAAVPLFSSCADYGVYGVAAPAPIVTNPGFVGGGFVHGGLAPLQVGFVATTFDRWAWDPYCRHYFDRSCGRYWDLRARRYCTVVPRRFPTAVYPVGYRRGARLACPSNLPRTPVVVNRGPRVVNNNRFVNINTNRGRYAPVVHGTSRGAAPLRSEGRSNSYTRGSSSGRFNSTPSSVRRTVTPVPGRGTVAPSKVARNSNLKTISTGPRSSTSSSVTNLRKVSPSRYPSTPSRSSSSRGSTYTRPSSDSSTRYTPPSASRSAPVIRKSSSSPSRSSSRSSSYTRSPSSSRSSSYSKPSSRSTSSSSRSMNKARQRTR